LIEKFGLKENQTTPEKIFLNRRSFIKGAAAATLVGAGGPLAGCSLSPDSSNTHMEPRLTFPSKFFKNSLYAVDDKITLEREATTWNNYLEFGATKEIAVAAQSLDISPWEIEIDGEVEMPMKIDVADLITRMPIEERIYRHRCVEGWAMVIPWAGFSLKSLVELAQPSSGAKYLRMESFERPFTASGQWKFWHPWPYYEGLTIEEATNELAFIAVGAYGKPLENSMGAPIRLVVPWKYGFKSIKAIQKFTFTKERPIGFWAQSSPAEYGFWANVHPTSPDSYLSLEKEYLLGTDVTRNTEIFNGYGDYVENLYDELSEEFLFK
tara:strand:- start:2099 stop:3070 length:972 start_codon:yes stop_codon:yes gene_type:complete